MSTANPTLARPSARTPFQIRRTVVSRRLDLNQAAVILLTVSYILLFEWGFFEADALRYPVNAAKLLIPALLALFAAGPSKRSFHLKLFWLFYAGLVAWSLIPSVFFAEPLEGFTMWMKYIPRLLFCFAIGNYLTRNLHLMRSLMKVLVVIGCLTVAQFVILCPVFAAHLSGEVRFQGVRAAYYGTFGVLGNVAAVMNFPGLAFPVVRLNGFWLEPSTAAGFMFAAYFMGRAVAGQEAGKLWRRMSHCCLLGGCLALSNAGYLAVATAAFCSVFLTLRGWRRIVYGPLLVTIALILVYIGLNGRSIARDYELDPMVRAVVGLRSDYVRGDLTGGRSDLFQHDLEIIQTNPFGVGIRIPGDGHFEEASGSAPVLWTLYTGLPGLVLLLLRESVVFLAAFRRIASPVARTIALGWIALSMQNISYGTWMTPMYLLLSVMVLVTEGKPGMRINSNFVRTRDRKAIDRNLGRGTSSERCESA